MLSPELLDILVCPETKQPLKVADAALLARLNAKVMKGELKNRAGEKVTDTMDGGLIREDGKYLYTVKNDIPVMLIDEAIPLS